MKFIPLVTFFICVLITRCACFKILLKNNPYNIIDAISTKLAEKDNRWVSVQEPSKEEEAVKTIVENDSENVYIVSDKTGNVLVSIPVKSSDNYNDNTNLNYDEASGQSIETVEEYARVPKAQNAPDNDFWVKYVNNGRALASIISHDALSNPVKASNSNAWGKQDLFIKLFDDLFKEEARALNQKKIGKDPYVISDKTGKAIASVPVRSSEDRDLILDNTSESNAETETRKPFFVKRKYIQQLCSLNLLKCNEKTNSLINQVELPSDVDQEKRNLSESFEYSDDFDHRINEIRKKSNLYHYYHKIPYHIDGTRSSDKMLDIIKNIIRERGTKTI